MRPLLLLISSVLASGSLVGQRTWIVDWRQGPGAHFANLPEAVGFASAGDSILVRDTTGVGYLAPVIDKPLSIIGVSGAVFPGSAIVDVKGRWRITNLGRGEKVLISNIQFSGPVLPGMDPHGVECVNNAGSIHFEKVEMRGGGLVNGITRFEDCADVTFHDCRLEAYDTEVTFERSRARLVDCDVFSSFPSSVPGWGISQTADAMRIVDSHVTMARSQAIGVPALSGAGLIGGWQPPTAGAHVESGTLVACADSRFLGGDSGCQIPCFTNGIYGGGTVVLDPTVTFTNTLNPPLTVIRRHVPGLRMDLAFRGASVEVGVIGPPQGYALLAWGAPLHSPIALSAGELWLDPPSIATVAFAPLGSTGRWDVDLPVWAGMPIDEVFAFQAGVLFPGGATGLTTPVSFTIQWPLGRSMP